jgi:hypothetical protein
MSSILCSPFLCVPGTRKGNPGNDPFPVPGSPGGMGGLAHHHFAPPWRKVGKEGGSQ